MATVDIVVKEQHRISSRLVDFGVTKEDIWQIVHKVVAARNDAVSIDPVNAPGLLAYIHGTRATRDLLLQRGWSIDRTNNVESTLSPNGKVKIIYQNAEIAAHPNMEPQSISPKGAGSARLVESSCGYLFSYMEEEDRVARVALDQSQRSTVWFLFVSVQGEDVRAELSCPKAIAGGNFDGFVERIFIVQQDEWNALLIGDELEAPIDEFDIEVTRKS